MVGISGNKVVSTPMERVLATKRPIDMDVYNLAQDLAR